MRHFPLLAPSPLALLLVPVVLPLAGCLEFKQQVARRLTGDAVAVETGPVWVSAPVNITIHPATRVRADGKQWALDARVRMVDDLGDCAKASGAWRFELHGVAGHGGLIQIWNEKVWTLDDHKMYFDAATRSYRFTLRLDKEPAVGAPMELLAVFTPDGGTQRMAAKMDLTH